MAAKASIIMVELWNGPFVFSPESQILSIDTGRDYPFSTNSLRMIGFLYYYLPFTEDTTRAHECEKLSVSIRVQRLSVLCPKGNLVQVSHNKIKSKVRKAKFYS